MTNGISYKASLQKQKIIWQKKSAYPSQKNFLITLDSYTKFLLTSMNKKEVATFSIGSLDT